MKIAKKLFLNMFQIKLYFGTIFTLMIIALEDYLLVLGQIDLKNKV